LLLQIDKTADQETDLV